MRTLTSTLLRPNGVAVRVREAGSHDVTTSSWHATADPGELPWSVPGKAEVAHDDRISASRIDLKGGSVTVCVDVLATSGLSK